MKKSYKIKSKYRKRIMELLGKYFFLPNRGDLMVAAFPELENPKRFEKTLENMRRIDFLKRGRIGNDSARTERNVIMLTKEGEAALKTNGIAVNQTARRRGARDDSKDLQRKISEVDIFMRGAIDETFSDYFFLRYLQRDSLLNVVRNSGGDIRQAQSARPVGVLETRYDVFPVYYIGINNICITKNNELNFMTPVCERLGKEVNVDRKILYAKNAKVLPKLFLDHLKDKQIRNLLHVNRFIFSPNLLERENEKAFLLFSDVEQMKLVDFFRFQNASEKLDEYVREIVGLNFGERAFKSKYKAFDTGNVIGINIVEQELYKLLWLVKFLKISQDVRVLIFGLPENKLLYDELFAEYENAQFVEIDYFEAMKFILT